MTTFGEHVAALRDGLRMSQAQLAASAGLSQAAISKAECAETLADAGKMETVTKIAAAFGMSYAELTGDASVSSAARHAATPSWSHADVTRAALIVRDIQGEDASVAFFTAYLRSGR